VWLGGSVRGHGESVSNGDLWTSKCVLQKSLVASGFSVELLEEVLSLKRTCVSVRVRGLFSGRA